MNHLLYNSIDYLPKLLTILLVLLIAIFTWVSWHPNRKRITAYVWRYGWMMLIPLTAMVLGAYYSSYPFWLYTRGGVDLLNAPLLSYLWVCWLLSKK